MPLDRNHLLTVSTSALRKIILEPDVYATDSKGRNNSINNDALNYLFS